MFIDPIDSHIHLFDKDGNNELYRGWRCVGFADVDQDISSYGSFYDEYIKRHRINGCLLSTGTDVDDIIRTYEKHSDVCHGLGELKYYKEYINSKGERKVYSQSPEWLDALMSYARKMRIPVMIHWDITDDNRGELVEALEKYPDITLVHCHAGCGDPQIYKDNADTFYFCDRLSAKYKNYYYDLSWSSADLLVNTEYVLNIDKVLIGTDLNPDLARLDPDKATKIYKEYTILMNRYDMGVRSIINCKKIFNI